MPTFVYEARNGVGEKVKGQLDADDKREVMRALRQDGLLVTNIEVQKSTDVKEMGQRFKGLLGARVNSQELAILTRQFATLYAAGVPIATTLRALAEQSENKTLASSLDDVLENVMQGMSLAEALEKHPRIYPELMINMIKVGETSGALEETLERLSDFYTREYELSQKIQTAMYYPVAVGIMAVFVSWLLIVKVVPNFVTSFAAAGAKLPLPTRMLLVVSNVLQQYSLLVLVGAVATFIALRFFAKTPVGRAFFDRLKLNLPVFGKLFRLNILARFCRILATLQRSGVNILEALTLVSKSVDNVAMGAAIEEAREQARTGNSIVGPLERNPYYPPILVHMMRIGEESGTTDQMLEKVADFYDRDIANMTERLTALLEPLITVVLAVIVGGILLAIVTPMFEMMNLIK